MAKNKHPTKADTATIALRVEEVLRLRLEGFQFHEIVQYGSEKGWNVGERQIRKYIARADDLLVERQDRGRKRVIARHLAQRQSLYRRALAGNDHRTALAVLSDEAKLRGLYPAVQLKVERPDTAGELLREALRRDLDQRRASGGARDVAGQPGAAGGNGPAPDVADAATPPTD